MKLYVASSFSLLPKIEKVVQRLEEAGHEVLVKWWTRIGLKKQFMILTPDEFYAEPECGYAFNRDYHGIKECDALIFVAADEPRSYNGGNVEIGMAFGMEKPVYCIGPLVNSAMYWGVKRCNSIDEVLVHLNGGS